MRRFKNILLLYECDRATLDQAAALAKSNHAQLTVVQTVREMPEQSRQMALNGELVDLQELVVKECQTRLEQIVSPFKMEGLRTSAKVLVGIPFLEIIREVLANERDLIIMTAEGKGGMKKRLFGSTSLHLMRKCPCPVWVMKPTQRKRFSRILAAVDSDEADKTNKGLNATILQLASSLATQNEAELHVIHTWTLLYENLMRGQGGFSESQIRNCAESEEIRHRKSLEKLLAKQASGGASVHLIRGAADVVIPQFTKNHSIDLLVMGTVCRTGIPGFFIGNTAEKILHEVDCSVLTVKPEGFASPVKLA